MTRRQASRQLVVIAGQSDPGERRLDIMTVTFAKQTRSQIEILSGCQIRFERRKVAKVGDVGVTASRAHHFALQSDFTLFRREETGEYAQQGGFTGTVFALNQQGFRVIDLECELVEYWRRIADERQIDSLQERGRRWGHELRSVAFKALRHSIQSMKTLSLCAIFGW